jgi:hypothetical protein
MLLIIAATSVSVERAFSALKCPNLQSSTQALERLTKLSLLTTGKTIIQDLENTPNFCDSVVDIFTEEESSHGTEEQGAIQNVSSVVAKQSS